MHTLHLSEVTIATLAGNNIISQGFPILPNVHYMSVGSAGSLWSIRPSFSQELGQSREVPNLNVLIGHHPHSSET